MRRLAERKIIMRKIILALFGCSASGKTALAEYLAAHDGYTKIKTMTTRKKRTPSESDYHFVTVEQFKRTHPFASTKFDGSYYGTSLDDVKRLFAAKHLRLVIILTWSGIVHYCKQFRDTSVKVYPIEVYAQRGEIMRRLSERKDSYITKSDIQDRLRSYGQQAERAERSNINSYTVNSYPNGLKNEVKQIKKIVG